MYRTRSVHSIIALEIEFVFSQEFVMVLSDSYANLLAATLDLGTLSINLRVDKQRFEAFPACMAIQIRLCMIISCCQIVLSYLLVIIHSIRNVAMNPV